jgi:SNF2 family DNA or RNA helicase
MMLLDRLLEALVGKNAKIDPLTKRPHKVLIFSQFVRMLDIIEVSGPPSTTGSPH